jgi:hypothetical protein
MGESSPKARIKTCRARVEALTLMSAPSPRSRLSLQLRVEREVAFGVALALEAIYQPTSQK